MVLLFGRHPKKMLMILIPGRREGEKHCEATERWAFEESSEMVHLFRLAYLVGCKLTTNGILVFMFGIPEIMLYSVTFFHITLRTNHTGCHLTTCLWPRYQGDKIVSQLNRNTHVLKTIWLI